MDGTDVVIKILKGKNGKSEDVFSPMGNLFHCLASIFWEKTTDRNLTAARKEEPASPAHGAG